jgi:TATA-binding protein-associated factor Taf7
MAFANSLDDALDECVDYLEDANLPGYFVDDIVNAEFARFVAEGMDEEDAREHAEADTTTAGNHGRRLNSEDWGVEAEDPTDAQLRQIGQVDEMREAAQHDREYAERHRELMRPKIWVSEMSAEVARKLHERPGTPVREPRLLDQARADVRVAA